MNHREPRPRLWPLLLCLGAHAVALEWTWQLWDAPSRQSRFLQTLAATLLLAIAVVVWLALLSRLPWRTRLLGLAGFLVLGVVLSQTVTVRGVSGDVVPILAWRWSPRVDETLERNLPTAAEAAPATPDAGPSESEDPEPPADPEPSAAPEQDTESPAREAVTTAADVAPREPVATSPDDFPQFLGPDRDATLRGRGCVLSASHH